MAIQLKNWIRFVDIMTKRETMNDSEIATDLELKDAGAVQSWISRLKGRARKEAGIDDLIGEWKSNPNKFRALAMLEPIADDTPAPAPAKTEPTPEPVAKPQSNTQSPPRRSPAKKKKLEEVDFELNDIIMHVVDLKKNQDDMLETVKEIFGDDADDIDSLNPIMKSFLHATIGKGKKRVRMAEDTVKFIKSYFKANNLKVVKDI